MILFITFVIFILDTEITEYALDRNGIKGKDWTITNKLNENLATRIQTNHGYTRKVEIEDSIRQGCILSVLQYMPI